VGEYRYKEGGTGVEEGMAEGMVGPKVDPFDVRLIQIAYSFAWLDRIVGCG
jgi:hypothetical protein